MKIFFKIFISVFMVTSLYSKTSTSNTDLDKLMKASGIEHSMNQVPLSMKTMLNFALAKQSQDIIDDFNNAVDKSYDIDVIVSDVKAYFTKNLDSSVYPKLLKWFESDLGVYIVNLEQAPNVNTNKNDLLALSQNNKRSNLVKDIDKAAQISNGSFELAMSTQYAMMSSMMSLLPEQFKMSNDEIKAKMDADRDKVEKSIQEQIYYTLLSKYQYTSIEDLKKYLAFASSKDGNKFYTVQNRALKEAIYKASENFGKMIGKISLNKTNLQK